MKKFLAVGFLSVFSFLYSSCIDLSCSIDFQDNTSGTVSLDYTLSYWDAGIYNWRDQIPFYSIPRTADELTSFLFGKEGITIIQIPEYSETIDGINLKTVFGFTGVENLDNLLKILNPEYAAELALSGGAVRFTLSLPAETGSMNEDTIRLIGEIFSGSAILLKIKSPVPAESWNRGIAEDDGTIIYEAPLEDYFRQNINLEVIW